MRIFDLWTMVLCEGEGAGGGAGDGGAGEGGAGEGGGGKPPAGGGSGDGLPFKTFDEFVDTLPADVKGSASLQRMKGKSFEDFARSFVEGQTKLQMKRLPVPSGPDDKAAYDEIYSALGRPEAAEKYDIKAPEGVTFDATDTKLHEFMRPVLHEAGITQAQLDVIGPKFTEFFKGVAGDITKDSAAKIEADWADLKSEWGQAFDAKSTKAKAAAKAFGYDEAKLAALEKTTGTAGLMRLFAQIGEKIGGTGTGQGDGGGGFGELSPAEAKAAISEFDVKYKDALQSRGHPEHQKRKEERSRLFAIAYPGEGSNA